MTVRQITREKSLRLYKIRRVQALQPNDCVTRQSFHHWTLRNLQREPHFFERVLFMNESSFSSCSILDRQNARICAYRNPDATDKWFDEERTTINAWAGIVENCITAPMFYIDKKCNVFVIFTLASPSRIILRMLTKSLTNYGRSASYWRKSLDRIQTCS